MNTQYKQQISHLRAWVLASEWMSWIKTTKIDYLDNSPPPPMIKQIYSLLYRNFTKLFVKI